MRMIIFLLTLLFIMTNFLPIRAQPSEAIDQYLNEVYLNHVMPGFSVVVTDKIEVVFSASYGFTEVGGTKPFTAQTVNPVGSLTKSITALAIMQLMEAGKIHLDHPVKHYIPEFTTANPSKSNRITVRMLLNNTAGLSGDIAPTYDTSESSVEHLVKTLSNTFILTNPGKVYQYSNIGFSLAGLLVNRVSRQPYAEYVRDNIFAPLNMHRSWVLPPVNSPSSTDHYPGIDRVITDQSEEIRSGEFVAAGQYTQSTTADLANYLRLYLNSGLFNNKRVVADSLIHQMWKHQIDFLGLSVGEGGDSQRYQYGLGWMISEIDERKIIHHGGSTGTASSFTMIDPENGLAASLLTNVDLTLIDRYQYDFGLTIVNNVLHLAAGNSITDFASPTEPDQTLNQYQLSEDRFANYTGVYRHKSGGDHFVYFGNPSLEISEVGNELKGTVYRTGQVINEFKLDFVNPSLAVTRNVASPTYLRFQLGRSGKVNSVYCFGMELSRADNRQNLETTPYQFESLTFSLPSQWESLPTQNGLKLLNPEGLMVEINNDSVEGLSSSITTTPSPYYLNIIHWKKRADISQKSSSEKLVTTFSTLRDGQPINVKFTSAPEVHSYLLQTIGKRFLSGIVPFTEKGSTTQLQKESVK